MSDGNSSDNSIAGFSHAAARRAEHIPTALLKSGVRLAISQALEPIILRLVDGTLRQALSRAIDEAPGGAASKELEQKLESLLHTMVQETIDAILTGPAGAELEAHGLHAVTAALHRDGTAAQHEAGEALSAAGEAVSQVLHDHRKELAGATTGVLTKATADVAKDKVEEGAKALGVEPGQSHKNREQLVVEERAAGDSAPAKNGKEKRESLKKEKGHEIRDQLSDAGETLMSQLSVQTKELQARLKSELGSDVKKSMQNQNLGRAPTGGHPSARRPASPGPSQGAPGTKRRK